MITWITTTYIGKLITVFFISMVPVIELRGAIPWGMSHGLEPLQVLVVGILGTMVPVPIIILFLEHVFNWLKNFKKTASLVESLEKRAHVKGQKVDKYKNLGLFILVAIPLPGTGAWTGSLVASVLDIPLKKAFPIILLGVITAGIIMLLLSHGFKSVF